VPTKAFDAATGRCRVEFRLPPEAGARQAWLVGDFNDWSVDACPMEPRPDGSLTVVLLLDAGKSYRFRYYLGDDEWENDWAADAYTDNEHGGQDSVVTVPVATSEAASPGELGDGPGPQAARATVEDERGGPPPVDAAGGKPAAKRSTAPVKKAQGATKAAGKAPQGKAAKKAAPPA
jgi:hypothetical protein